MHRLGKKNKHKMNIEFLPFVSSKIREELGMKPLSRDKFSSLSSPSTREKTIMKKVTSSQKLRPETLNVEFYSKAGRFNHLNAFVFSKTHILDAVLLLLRDLDEEELHIVHTAAQNRLQTYTLDSGDAQRVTAQTENC